MLEKLLTPIFDAVGAMFNRLFLDNPTAAAWAVCFLIGCYALYKAAMYAKGLQDKLDTANIHLTEELEALRKEYEAKISGKDQEIALLNSKFHEHVTVATNAFNTVKNVLVRTSSKPYILNCHNGILALGAHVGLAPHMMNMPAINDQTSAD